MTSVPPAKLQAFLDGRLPPDERARLARYLAEEPGLARDLSEVAAEAASRASPADTPAWMQKWLRLRPRPPMEAPLAADFDPPAITTGGPQRRAWLSFGTAAVIGLAVVAAIQFLSPSGGADLIRAHQDFVATAPLPDEARPSVPDLGPAGFTIERVRPMLGGLYVGYTGPAGCRLGLWNGPVTALPAALPPGWRARIFYRGNTALWLVTEPVLDAGRFAALADLARSGGGAAVPVDAAALAAPCLEPTPGGEIRPAGSRR